MDIVALFASLTYQIPRQLIANWQFQKMDNVKISVEKVVAFAFERWSFTRSSPVYKSFD